ncbi:MAG: aminopeptidase P family protein [Chloroflexi bacterium]|nr:aminopeptidase P family protein [Chloroflexota bacterium]
MKTPTWQYFSLDEYRARMDALRRRMQEKGVDAMLVHTPENLYYLTGYQTPGYYWYQTLVVPLDREPVFITRLLEDANVQHLSWVEESRPYGDSDDWTAKTREVVEELGLGSRRIGIEKDSWFITLRDFESLSSGLASATFVDCSGLVEEGRMIKSPAELEYMRQAARAAEAGIRAGVEACAVGVSENDVSAAIHDAQIRAGSEYTGLPLFITSGPRSALGHATWYRQELKAGDTVFLEIPGCVNRYHAAMMRNVFLGEPSERMLKATEAVVGALEETIGFIKPGVTAHDAHGFCARTIADAGLGVTMDHRTAYSIGIGFAPDWGEGQIISINEGEHRPLQAGMTFHLIPLVYIPGLTSVGVSETVLVTESGCEALTANVDRKLFVR